jgi:hypothetical protein
MATPPLGSLIVEHVISCLFPASQGLSERVGARARGVLDAG